MSVRAVLDTNILIDYLSGIQAAADELDQYAEPAVSIITWMEVLVGARDDDEKALLDSFLRRFVLVSLSREIAARAIALRQQRRLRLPEAIIWATALERGALLVTRNTRDFPSDAPGVRLPYEV